jgi:hypothetical protein
MKRKVLRDTMSPSALLTAMAATDPAVYWNASKVPASMWGLGFKVRGVFKEFLESRFSACVKPRMQVM